jgi:DNA-directed RNA polymerase sigma subunit (sigma70/sigma32)
MYVDSTNAIVLDYDEVVYDQNFDGFELPRVISEVVASINIVSDRNLEIFKYRFGLEGEDEHSQAETGRKFNVTSSRVRQITTRIISLIRHSERLQGLELHQFLQ